MQLQKHRCLYAIILFSLLMLNACKGDDNTQTPWNIPHKINGHDRIAISYRSFIEQPKTLDPARSYVVNEALFTGQIYEPPLQYHYLKRPYTLIPLTATKIPTVTFLNAQKHPIKNPSNTKEKVAYSVFDIYIKPHIYYQPHPAFAKNQQGHYRYHALTKKDLKAIHTLSDFKAQDTRELTAADYVYQIKRLAHPQLNSPILGLMRKHILGLTDYMNTLNRLYNKKRHAIADPSYPIKIDLRQYPLAGAKTISRYHYQIIVKGKYPQLMYWLAMPFFAPMPWEADQFYAQPGMAERNLTLDWFPVGTGPYRLTVNNPNQMMMLERNPNFHAEYYPTEGMAGDKEKGLLDDAGKRLPFIDKIVYLLDKETIPRWHKFLQGYYDESLIDSHSFDQAIQIDSDGNPILTPELEKKKLRLTTSSGLTIFYTGFNMLDKTVGGYSERARKLRQAIAIAMDYGELISIFFNGRGEVAQGPLPPEIFGHLTGKAGLNPYLFDWKHGKAQRKSIAAAKKLLAEAGYANGRDQKTGKPLILTYDTTTRGADSKAQFDWYRKQFAKLGIQLQIRSTQFNRFQHKIQAGNVQVFTLGWVGDYPDPENFLFLFYGPNGIVKHGGANRVNYNNPAYDALFEKMKAMPNTPERQKIIQAMLAILYKDSPWVWGFYAKEYVLSHSWQYPSKPSALANNTDKYLRLDLSKRIRMQQAWNKPKLGLFWLLIIGFLLVLMPAVIQYRIKESKPRIQRNTRN